MKKKIESEDMPDSRQEVSQTTNVVHRNQQIPTDDVCNTVADTATNTEKEDEWLESIGKWKYLVYVAGGILGLSLLLFFCYGEVRIGQIMSNYNETSYRFFDNDLFLTLPLCLLISLLAKDSFTMRRSMEIIATIVYFIIMVATYEIWDYCHVYLNGSSQVLGTITFFLLYVAVPVLTIICQFLPDAKNKPPQEDVNTKTR